MGSKEKLPYRLARIRNTFLYVGMPLIIFLVLLLMFSASLPVKKASAGTTENIYASKIAIQQLTGRRVTDFWTTEYGEGLTADKTLIMTKGAVELNNDGIKRLFWCHFRASDHALMRLKIDSQLLFSALGW